MSQELSIKDAEWTAPWIKSITKKLSENNNVSPNHIMILPFFGVEVTEGATDLEIEAALKGLLDVKDRNRTFMTLLDRFIGQLIVAYSHRHDVEWSEAISRLNLIEHTGKAFKTLMKLPRIVTNLPDEVFALSGLTTSHFDAATSFGGPKDDPEKMGHFYDKRVEILKEAATDPNEFGKAWVSEKMRALQADLGVKPSRKAGADMMKHNFMVTSLALIKWNDEDYRAFGIDRAELVDRWEEYRAELVDKDVLPENELDPLQMSLPWRTSNVIEVEFQQYEPQECEAVEQENGEVTEETE